MGKSRATIQYIVGKYKKKGTLNDKLLFRQLAKLNDRDERFVVTKVKENLFEKAPKIVV